MEFPSVDDRARWLTQVGDPDVHREIAAEISCLRAVDVQNADVASAATGWLRIAAWNIERGRDPSAIAALISSTNADVALLSEVDVGMARTRNRDVAREVAKSLSGMSAFAVEYVELGLGKEADLVDVVDRENRCGLHGNAIVSKIALQRPEVVRLGAGGEWFTHARGEPRIGGRSAVVTTVTLDGVEVDIASVHLESHSDAEARAGEMRILLDRLDERGPRPAVVAGDLNTFGAPLGDLIERSSVGRLRDEDPGRFSWPVPYEPLFEIASERAFTWVDANVAAPTTRHDHEGLPEHVPIKLDWVLVRGLEARRATVVPAVGRDGRGLSDHELLAVSVRPTS